MASIEVYERDSEKFKRFNSKLCIHIILNVGKKYHGWSIFGIALINFSEKCPCLRLPELFFSQDKIHFHLPLAWFSKSFYFLVKCKFFLENV
jgi:hypothetical protein